MIIGPNVPYRDKMFMAESQIPIMTYIQTTYTQLIQSNRIEKESGSWDVYGNEIILTLYGSNI